jgi:hypothetical protein
VLAALLSAFGPALSAGFGAAFPKFETTTLKGSREAVVPSGWGYLYFATTFTVLALPGLLAQSALVRDWLVSTTGLAPLALRVGGVAVTAVLLVALSLASHRYAVGVFDGYRLP